MVNYPNRTRSLVLVLLYLTASLTQQSGPAATSHISWRPARQNVYLNPARLVQGQVGVTPGGVGGPAEGTKLAGSSSAHAHSLLPVSQPSRAPSPSKPNIHSTENPTQSQNHSRRQDF
ncbi:hypothetical protein MHYP_G00135400 [Metynnis hypsauchen]